MLTIVSFSILVAGMAYLTIAADFPIWITGGIVGVIAVLYAAARYDARRQ